MHDYCSSVYNSSLTLTQASALERLQANALKAIYGYQFSYRSLLERSGLDKLQVRRDKKSDNFARKCLANPKFSGWFPRNRPARETRSPLPFVEFRARTSRLYNSPMYHMRRRLNGKSHWKNPCRTLVLKCWPLTIVMFFKLQVCLKTEQQNLYTSTIILPC